MLNVVFMGTPAFAVPSLSGVARAGHRVLAVVTAPDRPHGRGLAVKSPEVKQEAVRLGLEVVQPERIDTPEFGAWLAGLAPDCVVVVAYGLKLPPSVLRAPSKGAINLHASLLPEYRGAAPIRRCIMDGRTVTGVTTMYLTEEWDAGDIILQERVHIPDDMTGGELEEALARHGALLLVRTLEEIEAGRAPRVPQDHSRATYAPRLSKEEALIDWRRPARDVRNLVRAMAPSPGAYTYVGGRLVKVFEVLEAVPPASKHPAAVGQAVPGQVVGFGPPGGGLPGDPDSGAGTAAGAPAASKAGIRVRAGDGEVVITELCAEGGRRMTAAEFVRGRPVPPGTILGDGR